MYKKKLAPQGQKLKQQPPKKLFQGAGFKGKQLDAASTSIPGHTSNKVMKRVSFLQG